MPGCTGQSVIFFPDDYVCVDIETTGLSYKTEEIIELSAVKVKNGSAISEYSVLINPLKHIPSKISKLTGITDDMVMSADVIENVLGSFIEFIGDLTIVGHNIASFDMPFISVAAQRAKCTIGNDYIDTLRLAKKILSLESYSLENLSEHYNVSYEGAHRALRDCYITFECFEKLKADSDGHSGVLDFGKDAGDRFGCCDLYVQCSDAKKCLHRDQSYARNCWYRANLEAGRIFYGANKNI